MLKINDSIKFNLLYNDDELLTNIKLIKQILHRQLQTSATGMAAASVHSWCMLSDWLKTHAAGAMLPGNKHTQKTNLYLVVYDERSLARLDQLAKVLYLLCSKFKIIESFPAVRYVQLVYG